VHIDWERPIGKHITDGTQEMHVVTALSPKLSLRTSVTTSQYVVILLGGAVFANVCLSTGLLVSKITHRILSDFYETLYSYGLLLYFQFLG